MLRYSTEQPDRAVPDVRNFPTASSPLSLPGHGFAPLATFKKEVCSVMTMLPSFLGMDASHRTRDTAPWPPASAQEGRPKEDP